MGKTPRKASVGSTPRAASAPKEKGPNLGDAISKVKVGVNVSKAMAAGAAPQDRGDPNNIKVGVRCRPLSKTELSENEQEIVQFSATSVCLTNPRPADGEEGEHIYAYDHVYTQDSETHAVFTDMAQPLCEGLFEGFNGTLFAYGQTGSGKVRAAAHGAVAEPRCWAAWPRPGARATRPTVVCSGLRVHRRTA
jgi:hypothetical protein